MTEPTITQADRKAAADMIAGADLRTLNRYEQYVAQAFAAHREAAVAELRAEVGDMLRDAFIEGATAVHDAWITGNQSSDPDFTEASYDYACAALSQKETSHDD